MISEAVKYFLKTWNFQQTVLIKEGYTVIAKCGLFEDIVPTHKVSQSLLRQGCLNKFKLLHTPQWRQTHVGVHLILKDLNDTSFYYKWCCERSGAQFHWICLKKSNKKYICISWNVWDLNSRYFECPNYVFTVLHNHLNIKSHTHKNILRLSVGLSFAV